MDQNKHTTFDVDLGARRYPIHIGGEILTQAPDLIPLDLSSRKMFVLADENVTPHLATLQTALSQVSRDITTLSITGGEQAKSYEGFTRVNDWLLSGGVDRGSVLLTLGGGVIGDLGGFAAASVMRGIDYIQIPTTLLAQVDSSVGGKTGINTAQGKNLVGAFYQPKAVLCDTRTLATLPPREVKAGYAEIVKYGLINNADFFKWCEGYGQSVLALEDGALTHAIETSCRAKADIVAQDEREGGVRALLNLGHTFAHAFESLCGYDGRLRHGEAVAMGMVMAFDLSVQEGLCPVDSAAQVKAHLSACGLHTKIEDIQDAPKVSAEDILSVMRRDKKATQGQFNLILTRGIGQAFLASNVCEETLLKFLRQYGL